MSSQKNQSLIDGITCLQTLAMSSTPVGCTELARKLDMNVTRVNRLLMTLEHIGLASKDERKKYMPGPGIHVLASQILYASPFYRTALKVVSNVQSSFTIALGLLWRDRVTYMYNGKFKKNRNEIPVVPDYPATESSIGRMLLALKDPETVSDLYRDKEIPLFPDGLSSLLDYLEGVRRAGRVVMPPFGDITHYNVTVPVGNPPLAALALSGIPDENSVTSALAEIQVIKEDLERELAKITGT